MAKEPRENTGEKEEAEEAEEEEEEKGIARLRFNRSREWFLRENFFAPSKKPRNIRDTAVCLPSRETRRRRVRRSRRATLRRDCQR